MLDIQFIRENPEKVKEAAKNKNIAVDVDKLLTLDHKRRELVQEVETLRKARNETAAQMKNGQPSPELIAEGKRTKESLAGLEAELEPTEIEYVALLKAVPNIPLDSVPIGANEEENVVIKTVGEKTQFNFEVKNHAELARQRGWLDQERAVKVMITLGQLIK